MLSESGQIPEAVYVILLFPAVASAGLKAPVEVFVIPVPDQMPPEIFEVRVIAGSVLQKGPT